MPGRLDTIVRGGIRIKHPVKIVLIVLSALAALLLILVFAAWLQFFVIGKTKTAATLTARNITVSDDVIALDIDFCESADMYKSHSWRREGDRVYLSIRTVLTAGGPVFARRITLEGDFSGVTELYVECGDERRLLWSLQPSATDAG